MKCLLINLIVFVTAVNNSNTRKPLFLPQLPVLEFNMAIKDSIGGWKDNAYIHKSPKACSTLKMFLGDAWIPVMQGAGVQNVSCPVPVGFYEVTGIDTDLFGTANFPKTLFYGTYRFRFSISKKDEVYGCFIIVLEIKRPWESNN